MTAHTIFCVFGVGGGGWGGGGGGGAVGCCTSAVYVVASKAQRLQVTLQSQA